MKEIVVFVTNKAAGRFWSRITSNRMNPVFKWARLLAKKCISKNVQNIDPFMIQHITTLKKNTGKPQNILDVLFHLQLQN